MLRKDMPEEQKNNEKLSPTQSGPRKQPGWPTMLWTIVLLFLLFYWVGSGFLFNNDQVPPVEYSTFRRQVMADNVTQVTVTGNEIRGQFGEAVPLAAAEEPVTEFVTFVPAFGDEQLLPLLEEHDVALTVRPVSEFSFWSIVLSLLPILFIVGLFYYFSRRMRRQGQSIFAVGQNRATLFDREHVQTTFADVAGLQGAKTELREIIEYLKAPERVQRLGGEAPKGILLIGPPGTGKTLLARAVAGEAEVPFYSMTGSDFMEMFVGVGASRVRNLFDDARQAAPCIIFIDELDSIGRRRGAGLGGGHDEREQTLNQLLSEMDGFEPSENIVVMAATNRPDILDPALLRPGRFDRRVIVDLPTLKARTAILAIHARHKPLGDDVDLTQLARGTPGFSGADLANLLNEAALLAAREQKEQIEWVDVENARDKIMMGLKREGLMLTQAEYELIAYHEAGHALLAALLPHADPLHKVTIVPRGRAMGVTQQLPAREKFIYSREYLLDRLAVMMGGRAAEGLQFDTATSGAENDLRQAMQLARQMVLDWGMSEKMGHMALGGQSQQVFLGEQLTHSRDYSESTAYEVDKEVEAILTAAFERATETLENNRAGLEQVAQMLLEREELPGQAVNALLKNRVLDQ